MPLILGGVCGGPESGRAEESSRSPEGCREAGSGSRNDGLGPRVDFLNLKTRPIPPVPASEQSFLGVLGGDIAGYPNGRRPGDDTVDISLRAVMGALLDEAVAPNGQLPYTDGVLTNAAQFDDAFPYLATPIPGSPNETP